MFAAVVFAVVVGGALTVEEVVVDFAKPLKKKGGTFC